MTEEQQYNPVAIVGAGLIGASWAALFLQGGYTVRVFDRSPAARSSVHGRVARLLGEPGAVRNRLTVFETLDEAVAGAALVHETGPEDVALKRRLLADIQRAAPSDTAIASSTSSLCHSDIAADCPQPACIVTAHPFNPPMLVPLVELFGIDQSLVNDLAALYRRLGKTPVVLRKEMIGHITNRLSSALWREALYLLQEGVASVADIDRAVTAGPGLRWATAAIREAAGDELIVQVTTESGGRYSPSEQIGVIEALLPEAVSVAPRELIPGEADQAQAARFFRWLAEAGISTHWSPRASATVARSGCASM